MQFFKFLTGAMFIPAMVVLSSPAPDALSPTDIQLAQLMERTDARFNELVDRQISSSNLTDFLGELTASLGAIKTLLSSQSLDNIENVVTDLSTLFAAPTTNQTKALIGTASDLLGGDTVSNLLQSLPGLLNSVGGLLTPALFTNITDIVGGAHDLLTPTFVSETKELINDVAPLVAAISQVISALLSAVIG